MARYTDAQITINQEDYAAAQKFPLRGKAYYVPGIGVDVKKISSVQVDRATKRAELGIPEDAFAFLTVGELIPRKGHELLIRAFAKSNISGVQLLICGSGREKEHLTALIKELGISDRAHLLGFRNDIYELLKCADAFCISIQTGRTASGFDGSNGRWPTLHCKPHPWKCRPAA